jgi:hypothetical protein
MAIWAARQIRDGLGRDESQGLRKLELREASKLPGWQTLNRTDKHVLRQLVRLGSAHSAEVFKNERALCALIPPAPTKRRPNASGHIHRSTLRASLARLESAGIFESWKTNGKLIGAIRTPAIRVWRLNRTAWARAWATLKHATRRNLYRVETEAFHREGRASQFSGWSKQGVVVEAIRAVHDDETADEYETYLARNAPPERAPLSGGRP